VKYLLLLFLLFSLLHANNVPLYFQGNKVLSSSDLYEALDIDVPLFFEFWKDPPGIDPKMQALYVEYLKEFYKSKGFYHTNIVSNTVNNKSVTITIEENAPIVIANIETISTLDVDAIIPFKKGMLFDAQQFAESKKALKKFYVNKGFCNAKIDAKSWLDIEKNTAYLLYSITPNKRCYFGKVSVSSPQTIQSDIVRTFLKFKERERYSTELIRQSYDALYAQEGIAKVLIDVSERHENIVPVHVSIEDHDRPIRFNMGLGFSSDEGFAFSMGMKHRNFLSNLKTLSLKGRYTDVKKSLTGTFSMPLRNRNILGAEVGYVDERFEGYKERRTYETLYLNQYRSEHTFFEGVKYDHALTYASKDVAAFQNSDLYLLSLLLGWRYDVRDKFLDPTRGYFIKSDLSGAHNTLLSDATYLKYEFSGGYIHNMGSSVLAFRAKYGSIKVFDGAVPASYRFYAGGMNSNRAYSYRMLGPKNINNNPVGFSRVAEGTVEYRFPISGNFRGVLFSDTTLIGNSTGSNYDNTYVSVGAGLRYSTPIGPIALDFGIDTADTNQYAVHFHIGELF